MTTVPRDGRTLPVIAIDGPGGSGKSTVARAVARRLGWRYLDSGALYRALTVAVLDAATDVDDPQAVVRIATAATVSVSTDPDDPWTELDGSRVTDRIRSRAVTNAVSAVSAVAGVRAALLVSQRTIISGGGIVVEGRDIGTTVAPDAVVKIFLTADEDARASRRHRERSDDGSDLTVTRREINRRDELDSGRVVSPLAKAADAVEIDTTAMSVDQVVAAVLQQCGFAAVAGHTSRTPGDA